MLIDTNKQERTRLNMAVIPVPNLGKQGDISYIWLLGLIGYIVIRPSV